MKVIPIDSLDDPRVAVYRNVKATNQTRGLPLFVLEGRKLFARLAAGGHFPIESALASDRVADEIAARLPADVPLYVVPHERISALVGYNFHLGVLACGRRVRWPDPLPVLREALAVHGRATLVVCPAVNDPENLGSIARTGRALGVDGILAGPGCPDPLSRRVLRVSMGAVLSLPVWTVEDAGQVIEALQHELHIERVAAVIDANATPVDRFERAPCTALVLGNEAQGLPADWIAACERRVTIPMRSGTDSLNVAVAAGILLYHMMK